MKRFLSEIKSILFFALILVFVLLPTHGLGQTDFPAPNPLTESDLGQPWFDVQEPGEGTFEAAYSFDYGDPTASEQAHLEFINRARLDPVGEAARLGIDLFEGVAAGAILGTAVQPLVMNAFILQAARLHSQDMIDQDFFAHYSLDGKSPFDRMNDAGYQYSTAGENIAFIGSTGFLDEVDTALQLHDNLFIDEGYPDRGHRVNILNENFKEIGAGLGFGDYKGYTYSYMVTCDFGTSSQSSDSFILGVVYDDKDGDKFYDAGEGLSGIKIELVGNGSSTTTATAGGYGIPVSSGSYTVQATLADGSTTQSQVTIGSENVKVDFRGTDFASGTTVATEVGASAGSVSKTVSAGEQLKLLVNLTNSVGAAPALQWVWVTLVKSGTQTPVFALTSSGWVIVDSGNLTSAGFDLGGTAATYSLGTFSMADIGLSSGDTLLYGYAYTTGDVGAMVVENVVTISVQ